MTCRIGFLLVPRFSALGFLCAAEPLRVANRLAGQNLYEWKVISHDGAAVSASNGMLMAADGALADIASDHSFPLDWLIVCSGFSPLDGLNRKADSVIRRLAGIGVQIGGLDTGAFILARAGLGRDVRMTMHWEALPAFAEAFPCLQASSELFEDFTTIFTCAGGTASIDLMLNRISRLKGAAFARRVSEQFIHTTIRPPAAAQKLPLKSGQASHNRILTRAINMMESVTDRRIAIEELTRTALCSARHLERLFHAHFGWGVSQHHRKIRLARARTMLRETDMAIADIAVACGFESRTNFSRAYNVEFGCSPTQDRIEPDVLKFSAD
ncbi:helix-turn-helix domain-containing protein [Acetobacter estunensis]|uniref:Helix-turn-helix domain-containing protein n=1 Tax=Acetobacter estunensis TaxID=104097 RepID=A0A967BAT6_9PROT|nr:GlxA family transcriptional regulator [Acetobacter estunensis]NHO55301.1 helix-turn-helix domain-containing protein [Acetobacter estunensis]